MVKLYEYIKIRLFYLGYFEYPLIAQVFYILDAEIEKVRDLEAQLEKLQAENKALRANYVQILDAKISAIDTDARTAFEKHSKEVPTVPKRLLKAIYTARTIRRKAPLLWQRFKYSRWYTVFDTWYSPVINALMT